MEWWHVVLFGVVAAGAYGVSCWRWPITRCWRERCDGGRIYPSESRDVWRDCWACKGTGKRIRTGRLVFNFWAQRRRDAR